MDNEEIFDRVMGSTPCNASAILGIVHPVIGPCIVIGALITITEVPIAISHIPIPLDKIDGIIQRLTEAKQEAMNVQASLTEASRPNQATEH